MDIEAIHPNFKLPARSTELAGGYDIYMPSSGIIESAFVDTVKIPLGFAAAVPAGYAALLLPRSSAGIKRGVSLANTVGVIDADFRGEWLAYVPAHEYKDIEWEEGDRLFQYLLVSIGTPELRLVDKLPSTVRGGGGIGSTGE